MEGPHPLYKKQSKKKKKLDHHKPRTRPAQDPDMTKTRPRQNWDKTGTKPEKGKGFHDFHVQNHTPQPSHVSVRSFDSQLLASIRPCSGSSHLPIPAVTSASVGTYLDGFRGRATASTRYMVYRIRRGTRYQIPYNMQYART